MTNPAPNRMSALGATSAWGLAFLFGALYFVQGLTEPTEGLIAQPVRSLLKHWGHSATEIGTFAAILSFPWAIKPLYGLCTDLLPIGGSRRRSYLVLTTGAAAAGMWLVTLVPATAGSLGRLLGMLIVPTVAVAFSDVVADALMVETGRAHGLTGRLQAIQWSALYGATAFTGVLGGYFSEGQRQVTAFAVCAGSLVIAVLLAWGFVRDVPDQLPATDWRGTWRVFHRNLLRRDLWAVSAFLFLWNFNPFSTTVLYLHMTEKLGLNELFYGWTVTLFALASAVASLAYGLYCRRVAWNWLLHGSIAAGILSTLGYWWLRNETSAQYISVLVGAAYMTGNLIQLDLAARTCDPAVAGTTFALLMSLCNLSLSLSAAVGSYWYDRWSGRWGEETAFRFLVLAGAACTAACWLLIPWLAEGRGKRDEG